jgi:pectinesterase
LLSATLSIALGCKDNVKSAARSSDGTSGRSGSGGAASAGSGGVSGWSGAGGASGSAGTLAGTATRPLLTSEQAEAHTVLKYLEKAGRIGALVTDNWDPRAGLGDVARFVATYTVRADGSHPTLQSAIDAAVSAGGSARVYIAVAAGMYRETVCVPSGAPPITLYGLDPDPAATVVVFANYSGKPKAAGEPANACNPNASGTTFGTSGSATFAAYADGFQAKNLSFANDTDELGISASAQAVALMTEADRLVFENVRVLGNQDTLYVKSSSADTVSRAYFKDSYVEGDVDFIFGRGTLVLDACEIKYLTARQAGKGGYLVAPATDSRNPYGILINRSTLTAEAGTADNTIHLGRAWDESQRDVATYVMNVASGIYPNGQALIRDSVIGVHVRGSAPWAAAATTSRPFSMRGDEHPANRLFEYNNTGP